MKAVKDMFDLRHDLGEEAAIDQSIRNGVRIVGTNLWVLMFAILIASVGLNVNSTAVIIGAMLISPLMGPLLGIGYGAGISDYPLIRASVRTLAIFVGISLAASTSYFLLSPLSQAQSELLARTTPTLWDVLIAFFGGCAGIVAQTRRSTSTIVPGAAIATALMPPLCTVGYGLASGVWEYVFGAFYLFLINAFFIALATFLFVKLMRLPEHEAADARLQRRTHVVIVTCVLVLLVPSGYLAYGLVRDQMFLASSKLLLREVDSRPDNAVLTREIEPHLRRLNFTVGGAALPAGFAEALEARLRKQGFAKARVRMRYVGAEKIDVGSLREEWKHDLTAYTAAQLEERTAKLEALGRQLETAQADKAAQGSERARLMREVLAQYPSVRRIAVADGARLGAAGEGEGEGVLLLALESWPLLRAADLARLETWMAARYPGRTVQLVQESGRDLSGAPARK